MEKKEFTNPTMEIVEINENEVIATSMEARNVLDDFGQGGANEAW